MATSNTPRDDPLNTAQATRVERAAQLSGMAAAFREAAAMGPQVLVLQHALLQGIVRSQRREAERLAQRFGKDNSRAADAAARAKAFAELQSQVVEQTEVVGRVADTVTQEGLFHGYVTQFDGAPAHGYVVKLLVDDAAGKSLKRSGSAKTDGTGYFRIDMNTAAPSRGKEWIDRLLRKMPGAGAADLFGAAVPTATAASPGAGAPAEPKPSEPTRIRSEVQVMDNSGRVVYNDPIPPRFDGMESEFRLYVLQAGNSALPEGEARK